MQYDKIKIKGFTLAEVLITLLIIGVVASMVIPALINDINKKDLEVENNNLRSILYRAHSLIKVENGGSVSGLDYGVEMAKKLNLVKNCNANPQLNGCWHPAGVIKILQSDGSYKAYSTSNYSKGLVLQNGIMLLLGSDTVNCDDRTENYSPTSCYKSTHFYSGFCTEFLADINGKKAPNIYGQDIRLVYIYNNGIFMYGDEAPVRRHSERNYDAYTDNDWLPGGACYSPNISTHEQY